MLLRVLAIGPMLSGIGCATAGPSAIHTDAEMELAEREAEDATLARLSASSNHDVADAAGSLARGRATR